MGKRGLRHASPIAIAGYALLAGRMAMRSQRSSGISSAYSATVYVAPQSRQRSTTELQEKQSPTGFPHLLHSMPPVYLIPHGNGNPRV